MEAQAKEDKPKKAKRVKLTQRLLERTPPDPSRAVYLWDTEAPRLAFMVTPAGYRGFVWQYTKNGRDRRIRLGELGRELTLHEARVRAKRLRLEVENGGNPAEEKQESRKALTVRDLAARFMEEHASGRKPATVRNYSVALRNHILPALSAKELAAVSWSDVAAIYRGLKGTPYMANRMLATVSALWSFGQRVGWIPRESMNPGRGHSKYSERRRGAAPSPAELARIGAALRLGDGSIPGAAFTFCMLTGTRIGETLAMRWRDLEGRLWSLPDSKTGPRTVYVGETAGRILTGLPRLGEYVFPSAFLPGKPLQHMAHFWRKLKTAADLPDGLRLYDVTRHAFVSSAAELGLDLSRIKTLVGHAAGGDITARYTHLSPARLLTDADAVSGRLWELLGAEPLPEASNVRSFPTAPAKASAVRRKARAK
jgi:integrase